MFDGTFPITSNYAADWAFLHKLRDFSDGVTFCEIVCSLDLFKEDHNPQFNLRFILLNVSLVDFAVYNVWHTVGYEAIKQWYENSGMSSVAT